MTHITDAELADHTRHLNTRDEALRECERLGRASAQARVSGQSDGVPLTSSESIRALAKALRDNPETWGAMPKGMPYGECVEHARFWEQDELRLLADGAEQDEAEDEDYLLGQLDDRAREDD